MRLLLDTHALLWALGDPDRLSLRARTVLSNPNAELFVSVTSAWELTILVGLGRIRLGAPVEVLFTEALAGLNVRLLPVQLEHLTELGSLPAHHRDPFDRMIIATAIAEKLSVVSADKAFAKYPVRTVW